MTVKLETAGTLRLHLRLELLQCPIFSILCRLEEGNWPRLGFFDVINGAGWNEKGAFVKSSFSMQIESCIVQQTHRPNMLVLVFEKDYDNWVQVNFWDPKIRLPIHLMVKDVEPFDYIPPEFKEQRPKLNKKLQSAKIDYSALFDESHADVISKFLAFLNQPVMKGLTIISHNASRQIYHFLTKAVNLSQMHYLKIRFDVQCLLSHIISHPQPKNELPKVLFNGLSIFRFSTCRLARFTHFQLHFASETLRCVFQTGSSKNLLLLSLTLKKYNVTFLDSRCAMP